MGAGRELCKRALTHFPPGRRRLALGSLHCTALHCTALHCTARHDTALHYTAWHGTARHGITLHSVVVHCLALPCLTLHGSLHFITFAREQQMLKWCRCV